jgi:hypothetical protein
MKMAVKGQTTTKKASITRTERKMSKETTRRIGVSSKNKRNHNDKE